MVATLTAVQHTSVLVCVQTAFGFPIGLNHYHMVLEYGAPSTHSGNRCRCVSRKGTLPGEQKKKTG